MRTVKLGTADVEVSAMCLGALPFGTQVDEATSFRLLDMYVDAGGRFIDTANMYSHWLPGGKGGDSEKLLGAWLRARHHRTDLFIATKLGFPYPGVDAGLRSEQVQQECEKSLKRLGTDYIDLYYAHVDDRDTPPQETLEALDGLVWDGKVRYLGASNYRAWRLERLRSMAQEASLAYFCCVQQRYSYLRPHTSADFGGQVATNDDLLDWVKETGVGLLAYTPSLHGFYARPNATLPAQYRGPDSDRRLEVLGQIAKEVGAEPIQIVFAWMLNSNPIVIPLVAATKPEHLAQNLAACEIELAPDQMQRLGDAAST